MEPTDFKTLNPSISLTWFPPHRRRPLHSDTFRTLARIISTCHAQSQCSRANQIVQEETIQGDNLNMLGKDSEQQVRNRNNSVGLDLGCLFTRFTSFIIERGLNGDGSSELRKASEQELCSESTAPPILESAKLMTEKCIEVSEVSGYLNGGCTQASNNENEIDHMNKTGHEQQIHEEGDGLNELRKSSEQEVCNESTAPLVLESAKSLIEKGAEDPEVSGYRNGGGTEAPKKENELHRVNKIQGPEQHINKDGIEVVKILEGNLEHNNVVPLTSQEDHVSLLEVCMTELGNAGELDVEKEQQSCIVAEAFDSSLNIDVADYFMSQGNIEENNSVVEKSVLGDIEHELEQKVMELEKLVSTCGVDNCPLPVAADDNIEEGEISGDIGMYDQSLDSLLEGDASSELEKIVVEQTREDFRNREDVPQDLAGSENELMGSSRSSRIDMEYVSEMVNRRNYDVTLQAGRNKKQGDGSKESACADSCLEKLPSVGKIKENVNRNKRKAEEEQQGTGDCKKKKRAPLTEGRKQRRKEQKKAKRREENIKNGVKRLKLQPVLKPKVVQYCRHYLKGRCLEGEKCNFSHDTAPPTKTSVPCCHFIRNSCMKGDDCPFDHQLSKYPCGNYASKGSCNKGAECMFSHEMPAKEGFPITSDVPKPDSRPSPLLGSSNSKKQTDLNGTTTRKSVDTRSFPNWISPFNNTEQNVLETAVNPAPHTPLGSTFSFGKSSLGNNTAKGRQPSSSQMADNSVKFSGKTMPCASDIVRYRNDPTMRSVGVPKGINFLSFGKKTPVADLTSKDPAGVLSIKDQDIGKSMVGGSGADIQPDIIQYPRDMPKRSQSVERSGVNSLVLGKAPLEDLGSKNPSGVLSNKDHGIGKSTVGGSGADIQYPYSVPKISQSVECSGVNSLVFGKPLADDSSNRKQVSTPENRVTSSVQAGELSSDKHQTSGAASWRAPPRLQRGDKLLQSNALNSAQKALMSNTTCSPLNAPWSNKPTSSSAPKALMSALAFAAKYESEIKMDRFVSGPESNKEIGRSQTNSMNASKILDFIYGDGSKNSK